MPASAAESPLDLLTAARGVDRVDLWLRLVQRLGVRTMLELGVWRGEFARAMLMGAPGIERYFLLDSWRHLDGWNKPINGPPAMFEAVFAEAMAAIAPAMPKCTVLRGTTVETIDGIPDGSLDLAYIDGDHTLRGIAIDLIATWPKVRLGGVLAGDDFTASIWQHDRRFEPTLIFPFAVHFAEAVGAPIIALPFNQFAIVKPAVAGRAFRFIDPAGIYGQRSLLPQLVGR